MQNKNPFPITQLTSWKTHSNTNEGEFGKEHWTLLTIPSFPPQYELGDLQTQNRTCIGV